MNRRTPWRRRISSFLILVVLLFAVLAGLRTYYPLRYAEIVERWAQDRSLNPHLIAAVIRAESRFRPRVVSRAGAIGLMQIMPATGEWIAAQVGKEGFQVADLYDPEINIRLGTWYLRHLLNRFIEVDLALAAYNAGSTNLIRWQAGEGTIFPETAAYIVRVNRGWVWYRLLYPRLGEGRRQPFPTP